MWCHKNCSSFIFFDHSHLSLKQTIHSVYLWSYDLPQNYAIHECGINKITATDWTNFIHDVCGEFVVVHTEAIGGFNDAGEPIVVEIDESKFFNKKYR